MKDFIKDIDFFQEIVNDLRFSFRNGAVDNEDLKYFEYVSAHMMKMIIKGFVPKPKLGQKQQQPHYGAKFIRIA